MRFFFISTLIAGLRSRSIQAVLVLGALLVGSAYLASMFSPRQPQTVALDVGLSGMRFTLLLLSLFWIQDLFSREIERRTVVLTLAYPVPRADYLIGRFLGIAALLALAATTMALLLLCAVLASGGYSAARPVDLGLAYWVTILGLYLDVLVVTAFAICIAALSTVLILPLALGAAFAVAARMLGIVIDLLLTKQGDGDVEMAARFGPFIRIVRWVVPDLSRLDWRDWPLYQLTPDPTVLMWAAFMALSFIAIFLLLAIRAFSRREFS